MKTTVKKIFVILLMGIMSVAYVHAQDVHAQCDGWTLFTKGVDEMRDNKYTEAIAKFKEALNCDPSDTKLKTNCTEKITECNRILKPAGNGFSIDKKVVKISANGGNDNVVVSNGKMWTATSNADWCEVQQKNNTFSVVCQPNESIVERKAIITVTSGNENQTTEIDQAAGVEHLTITTADVTFAARGNEVNIEVTSNTEWSYSGIPSWCTVKKEGNVLKIKADPNNTAEKRPGNILVSSRSKEQTINLVQLASNEELEVSTKTLNFGYSGGSDEIAVYGNTGNWKIEKFPEWCIATKNSENDYSASIECIKNSSVESREGTILIRAENNQLAGIKVKQMGGAPGSGPIPIPIRKKVSFGITAGLVIPSFSVSSSSNYLASAVNYGYDDNDIEKPAYSSGTGFTVGVIADIPLTNNLYLQTGLNYTTFSMKNNFKGEYDSDEIKMSDATYVEGTAYDDFSEKYSLSYLEIPLLLSYRFNLSKTASWQLSAGPYIGYGITGKCNVTGSTDYPSLTEYYYSNDNPTGDSYIMNCVNTGEFDLFGKTGSRNDTYTTGSMSSYDYDYTFKSSPFKKLNAGISLGTGIEFSGFNVSVSYDMGLTNIANDDYWTSERFPVSDYTGGKMSGYSHKINCFRVKLAYFFR